MRLFRLALLHPQYDDFLVFRFCAPELTTYNHAITSCRFSGPLKPSRIYHRRGFQDSYSYKMGRAMQNDDILAGYQWLACLDSHTCLKCAARDGLRYTLDFQPIGHSLAWGRGPGKIHRRCRCTRTFVLKSAEQMRLNGLRPGTRASAQGPVPADLTYNDWLRTEPAYVAADVLGVTCATIWRANNLHLMDLLGPDGTPLTVSELRERYGAPAGSG